jgi:hypothetical protein
MTIGGCSGFVYGALTRYGASFQCASTTRQLCNSVHHLMLVLSVPRPRTGNAIRLYHQLGLGSTRFARRYSGCRCCFPFLPGTEMFQFPEFPLPVLCVQTGVPTHDGWWVSPFRYPRIKALSAAPRGFSQPHTSFIGAMCQGIHRWLFVAWNTKMLVLAMQFSRNEAPARAHDGGGPHQEVGGPGPGLMTGDRSWPGHHAVAGPNSLRTEERNTGGSRASGCASDQLGVLVRCCTWRTP